MVNQSFDSIWQKIVECQGLQFGTASGLTFTYQVTGLTVRPSRTDYNLSRSNFEKAWDLLPSATRTQLNDIVRGPSYVVAILKDARISSSSPA